MGLFDRLSGKKTKEDEESQVANTDTGNSEDAKHAEGSQDAVDANSVDTADNVSNDNVSNDDVSSVDNGGNTGDFEDSEFSLDSDDTNAGTVEQSQTGDKSSVDKFYGDNLQEEIVEAIGQGSEDVKNFVVTTQDGSKVKFVVASGSIKQITSDEEFDIEQRLGWTDSSLFYREEIDAAVAHFENVDYFDALTNLVNDDSLGESAQVLAGIISKAHKDESIKTLVELADAKVESIDLDWSVDSDADTIEAYGGFVLDPQEIDSVIEMYTLNAETRLSSFDENPVVYPTGDTDYEQALSDEERYVIGAVLSIFESRESDTPGASGAEIDTLIDYAHGFALTEIVDAVDDLTSRGLLSFDDPFAIEEEEEIVEEPEIEEEELDLADEDNSSEYAEYMEDIASDNFQYYPAAIDGGTEKLGGALVHYINELRAQGVFNGAVDSQVEYNTSYNTLYEENIQSVEFALRQVVTSLEASKRIYGNFESIGGQSTDKVSKNSNLYRAAYLVETERNESNKSRVNILNNLRDILDDLNTHNAETIDKAIAEIDAKLDAIDNVEDVVMGEGAAQYVAIEDAVYDRSTTPLYYEVAEELGLEVA